jgi:hypothetical protein
MPLFLSIDICFYYQSKHNTLNIMPASTTTCFAHHHTELRCHKRKGIL